ncbi:hypothetical protein ACI2VC_06685 [Ralstonia nicotianae]
MAKVCVQFADSSGATVMALSLSIACSSDWDWSVSVCCARPIIEVMPFMASSP